MRFISKSIRKSPEWKWVSILRTCLRRKTHYLPLLDGQCNRTVCSFVWAVSKIKPLQSGWTGVVMFLLVAFGRSVGGTLFHYSIFNLVLSQRGKICLCCISKLQCDWWFTLWPNVWLSAYWSQSRVKIPQNCSQVTVLMSQITLSAATWQLLSDQLSNSRMNHVRVDLYERSYGSPTVRVRRSPGRAAVGQSHDAAATNQLRAFTPRWRSIRADPGPASPSRIRSPAPESRHDGAQLGPDGLVQFKFWLLPVSTAANR